MYLFSQKNRIYQIACTPITRAIIPTLTTIPSWSSPSLHPPAPPEVGDEVVDDVGEPVVIVEFFAPSVAAEEADVVVVLVVTAVEFQDPPLPVVLAADRVVLGRAVPVNKSLLPPVVSWEPPVQYAAGHSEQSVGTLISHT